MPSTPDPYASLPGLADLETRLFSAPLRPVSRFTLGLAPRPRRPVRAANDSHLLPDPPKSCRTNGVIESVLLRVA